MVSVLALVLLSVAALGVDLGNAMNRKQLTQNSADFAALAGADGLPDTGTLTVQRVADNLNQNQPGSDGSEENCNSDAGATITPAMLTDSNNINGEVTFPAGNSRMRVLSPATRVQFGLANVMGFEDTCVQSDATVMVGTPGAAKAFPSFATDGCDWGQRTIFAPASSTTGPTFTPDLAFPSHKNFTTFDLSIENPSPDSIPVNPAATTVYVRGTGLGSVTQIGFFKEGSPGTVFETIPAAAFESQIATEITITLPDDLPAVTTTAGLWWVRVLAPKQNATDTTQEWSEIKSGSTLKTIPFEVGESYLRCAGVAAGSYGDLILPRTDSTSADWGAMNMARGLQVGPPRLSLHTYPGAPTSVYGSSTAPNECLTSDSRTVYSTVTGSPELKEGTNCVDNGTGLTANTATSGLIGGIKVGSDTYLGRLDTGVDTTCAPRRSVTVNGPANTNVAKLINDDRLTCFMVDTTATVGQISAKSYAGGSVLDCDIYDSPRFLYQPVVQVRPSGGSVHYSIVDFRPAFISEQDPSATKGSPALNQNGVTITSGSVTQLDVIFFHPAALSTDCSNAFGPTLGGTTPTVTRLIN